MDTTRWDSGFPSDDRDPEQQGTDGPDRDAADPDNPFDEPASSPELQQERSDSLYSRNAPFWERVTDAPANNDDYVKDPAYWSHPSEVTGDVIMRVRPEHIGDRMLKWLGRRINRYIVIAVTIITILSVITYSVVNTVRSINVVGATRFSNEHIIALSGLELGIHSGGIDEDEVAARIERERYLRCVLVDVSADSVTIHVRERYPAASVVQNGRRILLDERGWVLEISENIDYIPAGVVNVLGLEIEHCGLGQTVTLHMQERLFAYMQILVELRALGCLEGIVELDMTTMDSITLRMDDGTTILLGNEDLIHEKIRALSVVRENLILNNYYDKLPGGTIVVADPTSPAYMPPGA